MSLNIYFIYQNYLHLMSNFIIYISYYTVHEYAYWDLKVLPAFLDKGAAVVDRFLRSVPMLAGYARATSSVRHDTPSVLNTRTTYDLVIEDTSILCFAFQDRYLSFTRLSGHTAGLSQSMATICVRLCIFFLFVLYVLNKHEIFIIYKS